MNTRAFRFHISPPLKLLYQPYIEDTIFPIFSNISSSKYTSPHNCKNNRMQKSIFSALHWPICIVYV
ncbi:hypothetical protein XELAEV_18030201mg [Xenopus laevis]|uniref:Uncharacterized protein n=1 Tax=Xenopus laevis TaxID=8355 RepID=A0A974CSY6_XENLA|nr:hypothetical protein XELAEV_18030201mg [Xenopus laevis]